MRALEAITAHFGYPLDVYLDAACLVVLGVCCAGLLFVVLGCWLLQEPGVREDGHRQGGEGGCAPQS
jgi:hypothetical protein